MADVCGVANKYYLGDSVAGMEETAKAVRLYRLAADGRHAAAMSSLTVMYSSGLDVDKDEVEAARLHKLAAVRGDVCAM